MNIIQTFAEFAALKAKSGARFTCAERANAVYVAQADGYVAQAGDAVDSTGRGLALQIEGDINVRHCGAKGDGITDDTSAINLAFDLAFRQREFGESSVGWDIRSWYGLYFPSGKYIYNGTNIQTRRINGALYGDGKGLTSIVLGATSYLMNLSQSPSTLSVSGISFYNGLGAYYDQGGNTVSGGISFEGCSFFDYTQAAIGFKNKSVDRPNLNVKSCDFAGSPTNNSIGIIIPGGGGHNVEDCWFNQGRIDIEFGSYFNGSEASVRNCRFGRTPAQSGLRTRIWIKTDTTNSAANSVVLSQNHFGNENVTSNDEFILICAGDGNTDMTLELPSRVETSQYASGFTVKDSTIEGNDTYSPPLIDTYSINMNNAVVKDIYTKGTIPDSLIVDHTTSNKSTLYKTTSIKSKGVNSTDIIQAKSGIPVITENNEGILQNTETLIHSGGYDSGFHEMLSSRHTFTNSALGGSTTKVQIIDSLGGTSAATFTIPDTASNARLTIPSANIVRAGEVVWVEFDGKKSSTNPATYFTLQYQVSGVNVQQRRVIELTDDWVRYRFPFIQEATGVDIALAFYAYSTVTTGVDDKIDIGIPAVYRARSPVPYYGHVKTISSDWDKTHIVLGAYHLWVDTTGDLRIKSSAPTSAVDGVVVGTQT